MAKKLAAPDDVARPRLRGLISTAMLVLISIMIVKDILVRRWSSAPSGSDQTQQSR